MFDFPVYPAQPQLQIPPPVLHLPQQVPEDLRWMLQGAPAPNFPVQAQAAPAAFAGNLPTCGRCGHPITDLEPHVEYQAQFDPYGQVLDNAPPIPVAYHRSCQPSYEGQLGQARTPWNPHGTPSNTMGTARTPHNAQLLAQGSSEGRMGQARTPWNR